MIVLKNICLLALNIDSFFGKNKATCPKGFCMRENKDEETYNNYFINIAFPIIRYIMPIIHGTKKLQFLSGCNF